MRITINTATAFITTARELGYMTIQKPYGILATQDGARVGEFITEGPHGPIAEPTGWITEPVSGWIAQDISQAEYVGLIEVRGHCDDLEVFDIVKTATHLVFGGTCNTGLLESGNQPIDDCFSIDENLQALVDNIECYYRDGSGYQTDDFACNDRM